jgi:hypothetical protein
VPNVKTEGTIKNEPSRDTGNIGHKTQATLGTRHTTKTNNTKKHNKKK